LLHLFVVFTGFAGIGMLTPPVCVGVCPDRAFREIPAFVLVGIIYGTLMIALPGLATWLSHVLF
jgi:hypothetical protein